MIKKTAEIEIKSNAKQAKSDIDGIKSSIDGLSADNINKVSKANEDLDKSSKNVNSSVLANGGAMGLLNDLTGGLAMTIKDTVEATDLFTKGTKANTIATTIYSTVVGASTGAMKLFRLALAGTGVGLLVIGLVALIMNFGKISNWIKNLVPGFGMVADAVMAVVQMVTDFIGVTSEAERELERMTKAAEASLAKNKKFLQEHGDQVDQYTKKKIEAVNAYSEAIKEEGADEMALRLRMNRDIAAADNARNAEKDKKRKDEAEKNANHLKELNDKEKAARDKANAERQQQDDAYNSAKKKIEDNIEDLKDTSEQQKLDRQKERDLEALELLKGKSVAEIQILKDKINEEYVLKQAELDAKSALEKEAKAKDDAEKAAQKQQEIQDLIDKNANEKTFSDAKTLQDVEDIRLANEAKLLQQQTDDLTKATALGATEEQLKAIKQGYLDANVENEASASEASKRISDLEAQDRQKKVQAIGQTLATASELLGQHTLAGKALAIASTSISTFQSAVDSYKGMVAAIPGPVGIAAGAVAAAASVASGLATVKKIISVKVPTKGGGGGGAGSAPSAPSKPSVSFQNTAQSQVSDTIQKSSTERNSTPIKTYVVAGDVTTQQSMDRNIVSNSKF